MKDAAPRARPSRTLRDLPSVDSLLKEAEIAALNGEFPRGQIVDCVRAALDECRAGLRNGKAASFDAAALAARVREQLRERSTPTLRRVINATGVVLHTGLGRAPLADEAIAAIRDAAAGYCNLELDLATGQRGDRHTHCRALLCELTGAEDALVVNNNAAATFLALHALAAGRGVIVSRGQLVEIGGSYRMPDIMAAAGCRMIEVGTTNRTHLRDYERAIDEHTAVLLRVHTSNYRIEGFTTSPTLAELVELAGRRPAPFRLAVIDDLGSGLIDQESHRLQTGATMPDWDEPTVRESVQAGVDLTLFSGDKLLGGPQAGIIVGRAALIARLRSDPLMRTYRPDKLTLAALEATLQLYRDPESLCRRLPVLRMLMSPLAELERRARRLAAAISSAIAAAEVACRPDRSFAGGGALPTLAFDTWIVTVRHPRCSPTELSTSLRTGSPPLICRIQNDALALDCRTLTDAELDLIAPAFSEALNQCARH